MIPGMNIYKLAIGAIARQSLVLRAYTGRTQNAAGYDIDSYAAPVTITGSMQAVPRNTYQTLGLDLQKVYATLYTDHPVQDISRDASGDKIEWNGNVWLAESGTDWMAQDGWRSILCVRIPE